MEVKLRLECEEAANARDGAPKLDVYYQIAGGVNEQRSLHLCPKATVAEAYASLNERSPVPIDYYRLPIGDETAPPPEILAELVAIIGPVALSRAPPPAIVFNCQMGRGRTTTGMACATILLKVCHGWALMGLDYIEWPLSIATNGP